MKLYPILIAAVVLSGCIKSTTIEFSGTTPGIKDGVFVVKTTGDSTVYGENIKDGKFKASKHQLKYPDYYMMNIIDNNNNDNHEPYEVYLEPGTYIIETEEGKLFKYPKITSMSKIQNELSAYYNLSNKMNEASQKEVSEIKDEIKKKQNSSSQVEYTQLLNKLGAAETSAASSNVATFKEFVKENPNSVASAHIMSKLNYEDDPVSFYAVFQTLSETAKNSDDGKEIGDKLGHLIKLIAGATAPTIAGKTSDGKTFDAKTINKKVILIDFWRAGNEISRQNHQQIIDILGDPKIRANMAVVSISLDTKLDWWTTAIDQDHLTWTNISDLKGDDSPNAANWSITKIPTYYLLDRNWKIIDRDISMSNVNFEVTDYLKKH